MAKKVQLMTNAKEWQTVNGVEVLIDVPQEDIDPITDSNCVEIEGHRTLEETINQENMFTPEIVETKVHSKVGGVYHDNVVDGAYEEAILYGNTQVNLVESVTTGTKYIPHSFTSFQGNESKIGNYHNGRTNQVAPLVKGVTMVNLAQTTSSSITSGHGLPIHNVKGNTLYTLSFKFTTKNTNSGVVIQSYDVSGKYLENTMQRTGLGDVVKFTFTTHANATKIHICNNTAYGGETIQLDDIMVIEGDVTDLDLPFFKGMRSVELSRPLTNLFTDDLRTASLFGGTATNSGGTVVATAESIGTWKGMSYFLDNKLKPNTKYLVMWNSLTQTQTSTTNTDVIVGAYHHDGDAVTTRLGTINGSPLCPTMRSIIFDTGNYDVTQISIRVHATLSNSETGTTTVTGLRVFEWDDSLRTLDLQTIGYFSGTKYVSVRALETEGKNLYPYGDINFTPANGQVWHDGKGKAGMTGDIASKSQTRFLLRKGNYIISSSSLVNCGMQVVGDKEEILTNGVQSGANATFILDKDTYCTVRFKSAEANVACTSTNIQIERGETVTSYEAYQSRYYKPRETEEIILRSLPNGVCDTFNLQTGELVQRIGEVILDENEDWSQDMTASESTPNTNIFYTAKHEDFKLLATAQRESGLLCDKMKVVASLFSLDVVGVMTNLDPRAYIRLPKNVAPDVTSLKTHLQSNPITIQYELKEPIITKLTTYDRVYNGQTNALVSMGNNLSALSYISNNYYLKVGNLSPVPAILEPITSVPYDVRLKPSTLYTVKYNRGGYSNSMKFDLGGSVVEKTNATNLGIVAEEFTVRTPAILSHEQLILSGTGYAYNFIIVEGDITGTELPYFEGMKDVKMPIVKNISRNLLNESSMRVFYESNIVLRTYDVFPCKPNTRYCFVCVGGETNCNWHVCKKDAHYERPENESVGITQYLGYSKEIVTPQDCYYMCIHTGSSPTTDREVYDIKTAIYEGSFAECVNYGYEDYKENSVYAVQGEIPFSEDMFEQGTTARYVDYIGKTYQWMKENSMPNYDVRRLRTKSLIKIEPNTKLILQNTDNFMYAMGGYGADKLSLGTFDTSWVQNTTITIPQDVHYISFTIRKKDDTNITINDFNQTNFALLKPDKTITLRSLPNGVKDELNLLTREYIQRVGEIVVDGSEDEGWKTAADNTGGAFRFETQLLSGKFNGITTDKEVPALLCDKYGTYKFYDIYRGNAVGITFYNSSHIVIYDNKYADLASFKQRLQSNPLTIQYELAEPIISHVRLVSNNQEREVGVKLPNGVCNTYNPSTGITTVRVGKIVLDGSADEGWRAAQTDPNRFVCEVLTDRKYYSHDTVKDCILCDKITVVSYKELYGTNGTDGAYGIAPYNGNTNIQIRLKGITTAEQLQQYLSQNPTTVWYELNYPQIQPDIVLPNGVHDEYNPETGVYTKRVGFIELDGSEYELWSPQVVAGNSTHCYASIVIDGTISPEMKHMENADEVYIISDSFETVSRNEFRYDTTEIYVWSGRTVYVNMPQTNLTAIDLVSWRNYLSQNPIKLWYELQTPITYQLTPYFGLPQPYAYEDGYLIHESAYPETTLPPEFKYKLVANRTGQIVQNGRKLQEHTTRLSNLEALIIEATIESLFNRELQLFELELMDIQLIDLGE